MAGPWCLQLELAWEHAEVAPLLRLYTAAAGAEEAAAYIAEVFLACVQWEDSALAWSFRSCMGSHKLLACFLTVNT